ncbi:MAG: ferredoxin, partial [Rhodospirillales bacterium]
MNVLQRLAAALAPSGLILRGGFHPRGRDEAPPLPDGRAARTLVMVGNAGAKDGNAMWRAFSAARARYPGDDPLNRWTRDAVEPVARMAGAAALFPFDRPRACSRHWPFQRWAMRAESVAPSPLGILIHPEYGLWHAYRAALAFAQALDLPARAERPSPCESCAAKPCLASCPVEAFKGGGYDAPRCAGFLDTAEGGDCMERGC